MARRSFTFPSAFVQGNVKERSRLATRRRGALEGVEHGWMNACGRRIAVALRVKKARGEVVSRLTLGYVAIDGRLVENAAELALIIRIRAMRAGGASLHAIADRLNV